MCTAEKYPRESFILVNIMFIEKSHKRPIDEKE